MLGLQLNADNAVAMVRLARLFSLPRLELQAAKTIAQHLIQVSVNNNNKKESSQGPFCPLPPPPPPPKKKNVSKKKRHAMTHLEHLSHSHDAHARYLHSATVVDRVTEPLKYCALTQWTERDPVLLSAKPLSPQAGQQK